MGHQNPQKNENLNSIFEFSLNASILKVALSCVCIKVKIINSLKLRITPHLQNEFIWLTLNGNKDKLLNIFSLASLGNINVIYHYH